MAPKQYQSDVIVAGGGLAGIVTALELLDRQRHVLVLDRDVADNLGGLAKKSFGGILFVDTPQQRRLGIRDDPDLAMADWRRRAYFQQEDRWPRAWARVYVDNAREMIYDWLTAWGVSFLPAVQWAERGLPEPGNTIPCWHIAWGTGHAPLYFTGRTAPGAGGHHLAGIESFPGGPSPAHRHGVRPGGRFCS
jgi:predicted oxidoreductase